MRYIEKQPEYNTCGPVAVMNALKWLRQPINYKQYISIFKDFCHEDVFDGTWKCDLINYLKLFKIRYKLMPPPTIKKIEKYINNGYGVILGFDWFYSKTKHMVFIDKQTKDFFIVHNYSKINNKTNRASKKYLNRCLKQYIGDCIIIY
jgi:hypothetical protein